jgi:protein phosphatase
LITSFSVQVAGRTDVGCVRTNNEDNFGYDIDCGIFVVCDGMGGQAAGEVASKLGVETVLEYFRSYPPNTETLASAVRAAGTRIFNAALERPERQGMGSTIAAVLVGEDTASIAHVGDSRVYLLRDGVIRQLTTDHSLVMEQVQRGLMTPEQAEHSSIQNIITRALGAEETVEPDVQEIVVSATDIFLLATDGLTKLVKSERLREIAYSASELEQACDELIQEARNAGGDDNITCLLLRLGEPSWLQEMSSAKSGGLS